MAKAMRRPTPLPLRLRPERPRSQERPVRATTPRRAQSAAAFSRAPLEAQASTFETKICPPKKDVCLKLKRTWTRLVTRPITWKRFTRRRYNPKPEGGPMEVFEAVRTLLAVREYQDKPIPPETRRRIVEAAHLNASSMNRQPWHFIAIDDRDTLRQLGSIAQSGPYIARAPFAVVVCIEDSRF